MRRFLQTSLSSPNRSGWLTTIIYVGTEYDEDYDDDDDDNDDDDDHHINQYNQRGSSDATKDQVFCTKEANEEGQLKL